MLNFFKGFIIGIGKINDIFDGQGINKQIKSTSNIETLNKLKNGAFLVDCTILKFFSSIIII